MIDVSHNGDDRGNHDELFLHVLLFFDYRGCSGALAHTLNGGCYGGCGLAWLKSEILRHEGCFIVFNNLVDIGKDAVLFNQIADDLVRCGMQQIREVFYDDLSR